jgi:prepilin-type N-terminal cleavage/methylation domain-containing protein
MHRSSYKSLKLPVSKGQSEAMALRDARAGFTLVELLTVIAVMSLLTAMSLPVMNSIKDSQNITLGTTSVSSALQRARTYAMAHDTYVWVGFYEEAANTTTPTNAFPYSGAGQVVIGMAASVDGTQIYPNTASAGTLTAPQVVPIEKLMKLENVHCTDLGVPTGTGTALASRPNGAYASAATPGVILAQEQFGIDSDDSAQATHLLVLDGYTFYKTIRFSPSGEAAINDSSSLRRVGEIDLRPTHGTQINLSTPNVASIQFSGIEGAIQTYRN